MHTGQHAEAVKDLTRVIDGDGRTNGHYNRAVCYMHLQKHKEAEQDLSVVISRPALGPSGESLRMQALRNRAQVRAEHHSSAGNTSSSFMRKPLHVDSARVLNSSKRSGYRSIWLRK
jgi:hypothetical protein